MRTTTSTEVGPLTFAVPYYSGKAYLVRTLRSILAQQDTNWRAVVVDDGSDADVEATVLEIGGGRIRYHRNPANLGIGRNFNRCIDIAETDLVTVLHNDDELEPTYCGVMRRAAQRHPEAAALFCRARIIGPNSRPRFSLADAVKSQLSPLRDRELTLHGEEGVRALLRANFIFAPTLCFRRSQLGAHRFPTDYKFVLDWELTTQLLLAGKALVGVPEIAYRYRRHENNATETLSRTQRRFHEESEFYDRMAERTRLLGWPKCVEIAEAKRIIKLNLAYRSLKSVALLQLSDAWRGFRLLSQL